MARYWLLKFIAGAQRVPLVKESARRYVDRGGLRARCLGSGDQVVLADEVAEQGTGGHVAGGVPGRVEAGVVDLGLQHAVFVGVVRVECGEVGGGGGGGGRVPGGVGARADLADGYY